MAIPKCSNQGWADFWKEDRLGSCAPENKDTAEEIHRRWIELLSDLPQGSRVLDIATGNGILLTHAEAAAKRSGKRYTLTGVELAPIDPFRYVSDLSEGLHKAKFIGGIPAENLPFDEDAFDVILSQYGLEYANLGRALGEIQRILVRGGQLIWLAHCEGSEVVDQNRDQDAQIDLLLAPDGPIDTMAKMLKKLKKGKRSISAETRLRTALSEAEKFCEQNPPANVVREVCTIIADTASRYHAYRLQDLDKMLKDSRKRLMAHRQRISDLMAAVLGPDDIEFVRAQLATPEWTNVSFSKMRVGVDSLPIGLLISAYRSKH